MSLVGGYKLGVCLVGHGVAARVSCFTFRCSCHLSSEEYSNHLLFDKVGVSREVEDYNKFWKNKSASIFIPFALLHLFSADAHNLCNLILPIGGKLFF